MAEPSYGPTYELTEGGSAIRCRRCGLTSHNPYDVQQRYCGNCNLFHEDMAELLAERTRLRIQVDTLESIIRGASEQLGQGDAPLPVAIARLRTAYMDAWTLIGRCDMALELVEVARTIRGARARASEMRAEIKKASGG